MDMKRKKQLLEEYKNRNPEMGVISYRCKYTDESFLGISTDTMADFNSTTAKLKMGAHPNNRMQELWNQYGKDSFELSVIKVLKYENAEDDHRSELEKLREQCLEDNPRARRIWR